jgi:hypothetical protein
MAPTTRATQQLNARGITRVKGKDTAQSTTIAKTTKIRTFQLPSVPSTTASPTHATNQIHDQLIKDAGYHPTMPTNKQKPGMVTINNRGKRRRLPQQVKENKRLTIQIKTRQTTWYKPAVNHPARLQRPHLTTKTSGGSTKSTKVTAGRRLQKVVAILPPEPQFPLFTVSRGTIKVQDRRRRNPASHAHLSRDENDEEGETNESKRRNKTTPTDIEVKPR